jgi:hypothetical protein
VTPPERDETPRPGHDPLAGLGPEDFSGYTAFRQLSARQKLEWLAQAAEFVLEARRARQDAKRSAE